MSLNFISGKWNWCSNITQLLHLFAYYKKYSFCVGAKWPNLRWNHVFDFSLTFFMPLDIPYIFVRTKIDKTTSEDAKKFPRTFCEQRLVRSIRERCEEAIKNAKLPLNKTFVISTTYPDKWDYRALVQGLFFSWYKKNQITVITSIVEI